ncbi:hypothetical protein [Bordetella sp. N]|nr:hypothetical protein [Bordetella sp. N]
MAKGQQRGNKEAKKPKQPPKPLPVPVTGSRPAARAPQSKAKDE